LDKTNTKGKQKLIKMEKKLILEVERILEIMGVDPSNNLIVEQNIFQKVLSWAEKELVANRRNIPGVLDQVAIKGRKVSKVMYEKILKALRGQIKFSDLSGRESYGLGQLLGEFADQSSSLYKQEIRKTLKELELTEKELVEKIKNEIDQNGGDVRKALRKMFQDPEDPTGNSGEFLAGLMEIKVAKRIDDLNSGKFSDEIFIPENKWKILGKNLEPTFVKAFREIFIKYYKKSQDDLEKEIVRRLDLIEEKLTRISPDGKVRPKNIKTDMRELFNIIAAWKKSADDDIEELLNLHIWNNTKIPEKVKNTLKKAGYVKEFMSHIDEEINRSAGSIFMNALTAHGKAIPLLSGIIKSVEKDGYKYLSGLAKDVGENFLRIFNYIAIKTPQFPSEILSNAIRSGRNATLVEKVLGFIFIHNVALPWAIASLEAIYTNTEINKFNDQIAVIEELCAAGQLENCPSAEEIAKLKNYTKEQFNQNWKEHAPLYKLFYGTNKEHKFSDLLFFTYLDEVYEFGDKLYTSEAFEKGDYLENEINKLKGYQLEVDTWLKSHGIDPQDKNKLEELKNVANKQYKNNEQNFKQYLIDQGGYSEEKVNSAQNLKVGEDYNFDGTTYQFEQGTFTLKK